MSSQRISVDRSIRADIAVLRHEFETGTIHEMVWVPGNINLADPGTKQHSPLATALQTTLADGVLCVDFAAAEHRSPDRPLG